MGFSSSSGVSSPSSFLNIWGVATVVSILTKLGVDFLDINVLADSALREGIKEFTKWPTIPQLYYKGSFVGGCDIVREMYQSGELQELVGK